MIKTLFKNKAVKWITIVSGVLFLSALFAPIIFENSDWKFSRILSRLLVIFTLLAVAIFGRVKWQKIRALGLPSQSNWKRLFATGFVVGASFLAVLTVVWLVLGARELQAVDRSVFYFISRIVVGAIGALLIGVFEEWLFRGLLFLNVLRKWGLVAGFMITNILYSSVHFLKANENIISYDPTIWESFRVMGYFFHPYLDPVVFLPAAFGLFLFGVILSYTVYKTGSLYMGIGLHVGTVFFIKVSRLWVQVPKTVDGFWFGGRQFYDGVYGWAALGILFLILIVALQRSQSLKKEVITHG